LVVCGACVSEVLGRLGWVFPVLVLCGMVMCLCMWVCGIGRPVRREALGPLRSVYSRGVLKRAYCEPSTGDAWPS